MLVNLTNLKDNLIEENRGYRIATIRQNFLKITTMQQQNKLPITV